MEKIEEFIFKKDFVIPCIFARVGKKLYPVLYFVQVKGVPDDVFESVLKILMPEIEKEQ